MTWMPFICLLIGLFFGMRDLSETILKGLDHVINVALILLMLTIGFHIGINDSVMSNLPFIGFHCVIISLSAIAFSIVFTVLTEKDNPSFGRTAGAAILQQHQYQSRSKCGCRRK